MHKTTTLFKSIIFFVLLFPVAAELCGDESYFILAQESKIAKIDTIQTTNSNLPNAPQVEQGDVDFTDGTNSLIRITDEGTFGAIEIKNGVPSTTTDKLYNDGGTLRFDGSTLGGGSGTTAINDLSDGKSDASSVFLGSGAGANDDGTSNANTAVGINALNSNTTGYLNTANGFYALFSNTTGISNTANGYKALHYNTTGSSNTANGINALFWNTTGKDNTANGRSALGANTTGNDNTANGKNALGKNTTGNNNTANGRFALYENTTGGSNTANGRSALLSNTIGDYNTANGSFALFSNTTGSSNTANGYYALFSNTTGIGNTANGRNALDKNTTGSYNTGLGYGTNHYNEEGSNNTIVGYQAGKGTTTHNKSGNIFLGYKAGYNETSDDKLYIENSNSATPLIWGDFATDSININGNFHVSGNITFDGTGLGATEINHLSDGKYDGTSLFLGNGAGANDNALSNSNTAVGKDALHNSTSGVYNIANGYQSLYYNSTGSYNVGLGYHANRFNQKGSSNTIIGYEAGVGTNLHNKNGNIFLGHQAGYNEISDNKLYIENSNSSTPLIWGDFANDEVKINGDFEVTGSVALGSNTTANGANSVAIGSYASTNNLSGSMILADNSTTTVLNSSSIDRMTMRFDKGYRLYSDAAASVGVFMSAGASSWSVISDSTKKENFQSVDGEELLNKISQFKLTSWNYKTQDPTKFRHYGPMAQDFYAAFGNDGIGTIGNDTTIASADFAGINFNAIQALEKRTKNQDMRIKTQDERIKKLEEENQNLTTVISRNNSLVNKVEMLEQALNKLVKQQPLLKVSSK